MQPWCFNVPLILCCDRFNHGSRKARCDSVDLLMVDYSYDVRLWYWITFDLWVEPQGWNFAESYESPFGFSWLEFARDFGLSSIQLCETFDSLRNSPRLIVCESGLLESHRNSSPEPDLAGVCMCGGVFVCGWGEGGRDPKRMSPNLVFH